MNIDNSLKIQPLTQVLCYCCAWAFLDAWSLIFFLFHHVFLLKVFGIFALVCDKKQQQTASMGTLSQNIHDESIKNNIFLVVATNC